MLGELKGDRVRPAKLSIRATCTRVPVIDGHLESVYAFCGKIPSVEEVAEAFEKLGGRTGSPWRPKLRWSSGAK